MSWFKRELAEVYEPGSATSVQQPVSEFLLHAIFPLMLAGPLAVAVYGLINPNAEFSYFQWIAGAIGAGLTLLTGRNFVRQFVRS